MTPPSLYFAEKDILGREFFSLYETGDRVKSQGTGAYPANGAWNDDAFVNGFFSALPGMTCSSITELGITFLFGYAPAGDMTQFQGAAFTIVSTP